MIADQKLFLPSKAKSYPRTTMRAIRTKTLPKPKTSRPWPTPTVVKPMGSSKGNSHPLGSNLSLESVVLRLEDMWEATRPTRWGPEPDWPIRFGALKLTIAYLVGLPLPRKEVPIIHETTAADMQERLMNKPGYRHALQNYLASLDRKDAEKRRSDESNSEENSSESPNPTNP